MSGLETLWSKGKQFLGVRIPIIAGAMTWISDSRFVSEIANNGAFGSLAAGNMEPSLLDSEIKKVQELTDKPFAVNLITIAPHYKRHLDIATKNNVPYIVFAGSFPRQPEVRIAKESGAKVMSFASTESIAQRLIDMGVDALILEGSEAGGHVGHVSLGILLQQVLFKFDEVPIFVAGGIATIRAMQATVAIMASPLRVPLLLDILYPPHLQRSPYLLFSSPIFRTGIPPCRYPVNVNE